MELLFTPLRNISDEEYEMVKAAQNKPETKLYTMITVAQVDGVKKAPPAVEQKVKPKVSRSEDPEDDEDVVVDEPIKRQSKKAEPAPKAKANLADVVSKWGSE
jgi:phosphotransacetylase